jgi:hypothetical protein
MGQERFSASLKPSDATRAPGDLIAGAAERAVERVMDCAREYGRYGHRDATMILVAYRHEADAAFGDKHVGVFTSAGPAPR